MELQYLSTAKGWKTLKVLLPLNESTFLDERASTLEASIVVDDSFEPFKKNQLFRLKNANNDYRFYIMFSFKSAKKATILGRSKVLTLSLVEACELLKQYKLETCSFAEGEYTFSQVINRIKKLAKFPMLNNPVNITWNNPKLTFSNSNLYNALAEVARYIDCKIELTFPYVDGNWYLNFVKRDGSSPSNEWELADFNGKDSIYEEVGESIANEVYSEATNIIFNNGVEEPSHGCGSRFMATDNAAEVKKTNAGYILENNIQDMDELLIYGIDRFSYNSSEKVIDYEHPLKLTRVDSNKLHGILFKYSGVDTMANLYDKDLTQLGSNSAPQGSPAPLVINDRLKELNVYCVPKWHYEQLENEEIGDDIYIYYEDNIVHAENFTSLATSSTRLYFSEYSTFEYNGTYTGGIQTTAIADFKGYMDLSNFNSSIYLSIKYSPIVVGNVALKICNDSSNEGLTYYNQSTSVVDPNKFGKVLTSYINSMSSGDLLVSKSFSMNTQLPRTGDIVKDGNKKYVISSITYEYLTNNINLSMQLNQYHARKFENAQPDTTLRLNSIPSDSIVERAILFHDVINVELVASSDKISDTVQTNGLIYNQLERFGNTWTDVKDTTAFDYFFKLTASNKYTKGWTPLYIVEFNDGLYKYIDSCMQGKADKSIINYWKAESNVVFTTGKVGDVVIPYQYVDKAGKIGYANVNLVLLSPFLKSENGKAIVNSYPVYPQDADFDNPTYYLFSSRLEVDKDKYEVLTFNYQVQYKGLGQTVVNDYFMEKINEGLESCVIFTHNSFIEENKSIQPFAWQAFDLSNIQYSYEGRMVKFTFPVNINYTSAKAIGLGVRLQNGFVIPVIHKNLINETPTKFEIIFTITNKSYPNTKVVTHS